MDNNNVIGSILVDSVCEATEFKIVNEHNGFVIAEGILQEGNEQNRNRRWYPTEELTREVNCARTKELVETGNMKGEAGHPMDGSLVRQQKIDPALEQVWYTKLWMDANFVMGNFRGTNNEFGRSFNDDLKDGAKPSFSLRALGSLINENGKSMVKNLRIVTWDRVYFPSHSKAYTTRVLTTEAAGDDIYRYYDIDSKNYFYKDRSLINKISKLGNILEAGSYEYSLNQDQINRYILSESTNVKNVINSFDLLYESIQYNPVTETVTMKTKIGDTINLSLEQTVRNELMNFINNKF